MLMYIRKEVATACVFVCVFVCVYHIHTDKHRKEVATAVCLCVQIMYAHLQV